METLSHFLWAATIIREPRLFPLVAIASNLPDFLGASPYWKEIAGSIVRSVKKEGARGIISGIKNGPTPTESHIKNYRIFHSLLAWLFFSLILAIFFPSLLVLSLAYLSHILVDIPTHSGTFATRIFYPLSDFHFEGISWVDSKKVLVINFVLLILINIVLLVIHPAIFVFAAF